MPRGAIFTSVGLRCKHHNDFIGPNGACLKCKVLERNLSLTPAFDVFCNWSYPNRFEKGKIYTVKWVIKDATSFVKTHIEGYCFQNEDGSIHPFVMDAFDFIPLQYLNDNNQDSWLV
jgi:hypothetical protein